MSKSVSTRTRFEIFKRDGFRCKYCGASPLGATLVVKLHADHVTPKSGGGSNEPYNLITACIDCNLGKSDVPLDEKKFRSEFASEEEKEHAEQIRAYLVAQRDISDAKKESEALIIEHWESRMGEWHWQFPRYLPRALKEFGLARLIDAVDIVAGSRVAFASTTVQIKYFCGILRRWRQEKSTPKEDEDEQEESAGYTESFNMFCEAFSYFENPGKATGPSVNAWFDEVYSQMSTGIFALTCLLKVRESLRGRSDAEQRKLLISTAFAEAGFRDHCSNLAEEWRRAG